MPRKEVIMIKYVWKFILFIVLITAVWIAYGMMNVYEYAPREGASQIEPDPLQQTEIDRENKGIDDSYLIMIAGDSIARGRGDQSGLGLAISFPEEINQRPTEVLNLGADGLVSSELYGMISRPDLEEPLQNAEVIILSIGGNDLRRVAFLALQGEEITPNSMEYREILSQYLEQLQEVRDYIRNRNQDTRIILIGLFNPFEAEEISDYLPRDLQLDILFDWNYQTQLFMEQDPMSLFLPTYDLFKWNSAEYLSFDLIHPTQMGYRVLSDRIADLF